MTIRYFSADDGDATRIAVVESSTESGFDAFRDSAEIDESDLPGSFANWATYSQFSEGDNIVTIKSPDGA